MCLTEPKLFGINFKTISFSKLKFTKILGILLTTSLETKFVYVKFKLEIQ